jgi:small subunit ribosomal protein S1
VVAIGDTVRIKVLDIDRDRQRISLGLKQTQEDPWQRVISTHRPGDVLEGTVTKVVAFGAFVEILPGVEGLVHISELADHHVENPSEVVEPGASLNVKILEIDEERRRLSLSIKRVEGQNMPMQGLGEQIQAAEGQSDEPADPVAEEAPAESEAPAEDAVEEAPVAEEPIAEEAEPAAEEPVAEEAEAAAEDPVAEETEPAAEPVAEVAEENGDNGDEDGGDVENPPEVPQEGESVEERPNSPDQVDEAAGEESAADETAGDDGQTGETEH